MAARRVVAAFALQQDLGVAQDPVQRRPELVAHAGQEGALGPALLLDGLALALQRRELEPSEAHHHQGDQAQHGEGGDAHVVDDADAAAHELRVGHGRDRPVGLGDRGEGRVGLLAVHRGQQPAGAALEHGFDDRLQARVAVLEEADLLRVDVAAPGRVGVGDGDAAGVDGEGVAARAVGEAAELLDDRGRVDHPAEDADDLRALGVAAVDRARHGHDVGVQRARVHRVGGVDPAGHRGLEMGPVAQVLALGEIDLGVVVAAVRVDVREDVEPGHLLVLGLQEGAGLGPVHRADQRRVGQGRDLGLARDEPAVDAARHRVGLGGVDLDLLVQQLIADLLEGEVASEGDHAEHGEQDQVEAQVDSFGRLVHERLASVGAGGVFLRAPRPARFWPAAPRLGSQGRPGSWPGAEAIRTCRRLRTRLM